MYMAVGEMGVFSDVLFVEERKWWWVQTVTRALEALACFMVRFNVIVFSIEAFTSEDSKY